MSTQLKINEDLTQYLQKVGYRKDSLVDELEKKTKALGKVAQMQIAKEQGQFLEIIVNISKAKSCLEIGRFTGLSTLYMARGLPSDGKIITVDNSEEFLALAQKYWDKDGLTSKIESIIGSGVDVTKINKLLKQFKMMSDMMKKMSQGKKIPSGMIPDEMLNQLK